ncbi:MAG: carbohydrate ABC transporter permease [Candidatus Accumulibacter sp.]|jgi:multiple sugar transport system permease protein|nr:carbohydrate ABC transporter permease [Accumulibacter sp.]
MQKTCTLSVLKVYLLNAFLAGGAIVMLAPFVWMLSLSLKPENEIYTPFIKLLPEVWDFENYREAVNYGETGKFVFNGIVVTGSILLLQYLTIIPGAYVLARKRFRLEKLCFALVLAALMIPQHIAAIPLFMLMGRLSLLNTYTALILPFMTSAFGLFLLRQSFKALPQDLIDAARIDGASEAYALFAILVPQIFPALAAFSVFSIVSHWNDFFWPLLVVSDMELATPPLGVSIFASDEGGNDVGPMMASATLIVLPLMLVFLAARKRFVQGMTMTGLK